MEVNKILKLCATFLQLKNLDKVIDNSEYLLENDNEDLMLLLESLNLVTNLIATDYMNLIQSKKLKNTSGKVKFSDIHSGSIYKIIKVKNCYGENIPFRTIADGIECSTGDIVVTYSYFPKYYSYNDNIDEFGMGLTERVFAFGVVSEYLFIKGNSDDASVWEDRFKNGMRNIVRHRHEVVMPKRRWW